MVGTIAGTARDCRPSTGAVPRELADSPWQTPSQPGKQTLMARAADSLGRTQPVLRDADRGTYMIKHLLPIEVEVK